MVPIHPDFLSEAVNHTALIMPTILWVWALAQQAGIRAQIGYKKRPGRYDGKPSLVVDNTLDRQFDVEAPDRAWVKPGVPPRPSPFNSALAGVSSIRADLVKLD